MYVSEFKSILNDELSSKCLIIELFRVTFAILNIYMKK